MKHWTRWLPTPGAIAQAEAVLARLESDPRAPTTVRGRDEAEDVHLADSLVAVELPAVQAARAIADLGSGPGFPGLALAIARPEAHVSLVESAARKCGFLRHMVDAAGVANVDVVHARAEDWSEGLDAHDLVTARALAALPVVVEYAAPLLRQGGALVAWRGRREPAAEAAAVRAAAEVGLAAGEIRRVRPYPEAQDRHLHVFTKVAPTPARFPRRPGAARKRPLGADVERA